MFTPVIVTSRRHCEMTPKFSYANHIYTSTPSECVEHVNGCVDWKIKKKILNGNDGKKRNRSSQAWEEMCRQLSGMVKDAVIKKTAHGGKS